MSAFTIHPTARLRGSPFMESALAEGAATCSVYNHMILPASYGDPEGEWRRLMEGVAMWDVGAERQVEISGPDADRLAQILCMRRLDRCEVGQGKYVAVCDHRGTILNDPVALHVDEGRWWLSIADSDVLLWARAVAAERGLDVRVHEPDVSPLAVQGPDAEDVVAALLGDWVRDLRHFRFREARLGGIPLVVCRSGWSKQGGFELFLTDGAQGAALWDAVKEAGAPWAIGPGAPTSPERTESGLVSVGGDTDDATNPFEIRMVRFVDLDVPDDTVGAPALRRIHAEGPRRRQLGLRLDGDAPAPLGTRWCEVRAQGRAVGSMTNCVWSYRLGRNIGYALVEASARPGEAVEVVRSEGPVRATLCKIPFE